MSILSPYLSQIRNSKKTLHFLGDAKETLTREQSFALIDRIAYGVHARLKAPSRQARIALILPRNLFYVASIFAIWELGHCYIPLNANWPRPYIEKILKNAQPDLLISELDSWSELVETVQIEDLATTVLPDEEWPQSCRVRCTEKDLAYIIYTSGSTGDAKGVMISQNSLATYISWVKETFQEYAANQALLITGEMTFDMSIADIAFALAHNVEVHISPDPQNILFHARLIKERPIDTLYGAPSTLQRLFGWVSTRGDVSVDRLKTIFSGGDVVTFDLIGLVGKAAPQAVFYNMYGPTEITMNCLYFRIDSLSRELRDQDMVPTGRTFPHLKYRFLDPDTAEVTSSDIGELVVAGAQCMEGYLNDHERTANAFIEIEGEHYYRTGDLFQRNPDDVYYIVGRLDSIVKIRGYRINTTTITNIAGEESFVAEARTIVVDADQINKQIVTFVVLNEDEEIENFAILLAEKCKAELPAYMVPARFIRIDQFPYGKTGKHDIRKLQELALAL